jgi:hypothetical protein
MVGEAPPLCELSIAESGRNLVTVIITKEAPEGGDNTKHNLR